MPRVAGRIDDLAVPVNALLRQLPSVMHVDVAVRAEKPTHRIIHLRNVHLVPVDLYTLDLEAVENRPLAPGELNARYAELEHAVESIQLEHLALARCLVKHHGLKRVFSEGLTVEGVDNYHSILAVLRAAERDDMPKLRRQLADVKQLQAESPKESTTFKTAKSLESDVAALIRAHELRLLEYGVPGRLFVIGDIDEVLPLDDAQALERAKPKPAPGKNPVSPDRLLARRDAIVKNVLDHGPVGFIVLGGSHDLTDSVRRLGKGSCEYIRITTSRFHQFAE